VPPIYRTCLIGCGRMGATIDDEIRGHPHRTPTLPWAHAAGVGACDRTELVAVSDIDADKAEAIRARYGASTAYTDYREMIERERPDIVCIATRPATHCEMTVFAAESGVRGIYCEKPLACSMREADLMVDAVKSHGVKFNYGTNRRFSPLFRQMRAIVDSGGIGDVQCVAAYCGTGSAQWWHTHAADVFLNLAGDGPVRSAQGSILADDSAWDALHLQTDPGIEMGFVTFENGVRAYWTAAAGYEFEVTGTLGKLRTLDDYNTCQWRVRTEPWGIMEEREFPHVPDESATVNLLQDIATALDVDGETEGNIELARRSQEIIFGVIDSARLGGTRVDFPMVNRDLRVSRDNW